MNNKKIGDCILYVNRAIKKEEREKILKENEKSDVLLKNKKNLKKTIIVKGIEMKIQEKIISSEFSVFGRIINCKILKRDDGVSFGLCFLTFKNRSDILTIMFMRKKYLFLRKLNFNLILKPYDYFIKKNFKSVSKTSRKKCVKYFEDDSFKKKKIFGEIFFTSFLEQLNKLKRKNSMFLFQFHLIKNFQRKFSSRLSFFTSNLDLEKFIPFFFCKKKLRNQLINYFTSDKKKI